MSELAIWMNGTRVGTWTWTRGTSALTYERAWVESPRGRPLSLSLPFTANLRIAGPVVTNFFDNLLPDSARIRERMQRRFGTRGQGAFDLLEAVGRDCAGAVQLLPPGREPSGHRSLHFRRLSEAEVDQVLLGVTDPHPFDGADRSDDGAFRISIAGAQEKTALLRVGADWCEPRGATPTTHILKLPLGRVGNQRHIDLSMSVENEWLCLRLLAGLGLPVASAEIAVFGSRKVLAVERFDRAWQDDGKWITRLPQEDFCQATGVPPTLRYEADGGPGIAKCLQLLQGSEAPEADRRRFLLAQFAFWLLGAIDGHAKNFSLFLTGGSAYRLTPLYDVLSAWPLLGKGAGRLAPQRLKMAMAVRAGQPHWHIDKILPRHWLQLAERLGLPEQASTMRRVAEGARLAIEGVETELSRDFPAEIWEAVTGGLAKKADAFLAAIA